MSFPRLEQHLSSPHSWRATLDYLRALVRKAINRGLTEPEASVLRAFMLGERGSLSPRIRALAQRTGVAHIFAISGLHIGLWILLLLGAASALGLPRIVASGAIILLTTWYVLLVGAPPSAVRAAIMAGIVLLAYLAGRPAKSLRLLLLAAAAMLWFNPALRSSIGFQLSFAAVAGIVLTVPVLRLFLPLAWQRSSAILFLLVSLSAQLATLPLVLAFFQLFPSASLPANFVMVPLLPVLIGGGWLAALAGTLFPAGAPIFFFPLQLLLRAQLLTLEVLEKPLPAFSFALDWRWLPAIYLLLLLLLASGALYARKRRLPLTLF
jgi:competence protein ComEC